MSSPGLSAFVSSTHTTIGTWQQRASWFRAAVQVTLNADRLSGSSRTPVKIVA